MDIVFPPLPPVADPDPSALLATLSAALDARDLHWIAGADHGRDIEENERQLRRIAWSGEIPSPLEWCPREVLELTRWDEPPTDCGEDVFRRRHLLRAFACAALLRSYGDRGNAGYEIGREGTVLHLLGSLEVLTGEFANLDRDATALLAWVIPRLAACDPEDHPFLGLAALWFALGAALPDPALLALAEWVMDIEDAVSGQWRKPLGVGASGTWLLSLVPERARQAEWRRVGASLPGRVLAHCGAAVRETVALIAAAMA